MSNEKSKEFLTPWLKGFLTSILGTTISIALTFGTTALVNSSKKRASQKLTAMMVIHDIDEEIQKLKIVRDNMEKQYEATQYVLDNMDNIDAVPDDTVSLMLDLIVQSEDEWDINESTEKIFNSSQDTWSNIDNMRFLKNAEAFYCDRRYLIQTLNNNPYWIPPVSSREIMNRVVIFSYETDKYYKNIRNFIIEKVKDQNVKYYLDTTSDRIYYLDGIIQNWINMNEENMFLMNISDKELSDYINKIEKNNESLSEKDMIGTWTNLGNVSNESSEIDFKADHTFNHRVTLKNSNWLFRGKVAYISSIEGKWDIKGDSLIRIYNIESLKTEVDTSGISYRDEKKDSVVIFIRNLSKEFDDYYKKMYEMEIRKVRTGSFDLTHNKLELSGYYTGYNGEVKKQTFHFKRKK